MNQLVVRREPFQDNVGADTTRATSDENHELLFRYIAIFVTVLNNLNLNESGKAHI